MDCPGEHVAECVGGPGGLLDESSIEHATAFCDPRLNYSQSLEMAFQIADYLQKYVPDAPEARVGLGACVFLDVRRSRRHGRTTLNAAWVYLLKLSSSPIEQGTHGVDISLRAHIATPSPSVTAWRTCQTVDGALKENHTLLVHGVDENKGAAPSDAEHLGSAVQRTERLRAWQHGTSRVISGEAS